jgi:hypothetical protein
MAHWEKVLVVKLGDLGSIPEIHMVRKVPQSCPLSPPQTDRQTETDVDTIHTYIKFLKRDAFSFLPPGWGVGVGSDVRSPE